MTRRRKRIIKKIIKQKLFGLSGILLATIWTLITKDITFLVFIIMLSPALFFTKEELEWIVKHKQEVKYYVNKKTRNRRTRKKAS